MKLTLKYSVMIISACTLYPCNTNTFTDSLTRIHLLQLKIHNIWMKFFWNQKVFHLDIKEISTLKSLGESKSDQKYFAIWIGKRWKPQKIIIAVRKLFNLRAHSWREFAEGILQVVLFRVFCFKWSVKKHFAGKTLQGIWERFLYENNRNFNSQKFSHKFNFIPILSFHRNQKQ